MRFVDRSIFMAAPGWEKVIHVRNLHSHNLQDQRPVPTFYTPQRAKRCREAWEKTPISPDNHDLGGYGRVLASVFEHPQLVLAFA